MTVKINVKQLGSKRAKISEMPFTLDDPPQTVGELITESVHICVSEYNERLKNGSSTQPLSDDKISEMSEAGKIAFGINYGGKYADETAAVENALQSYEDGLYRIFAGEDELGALDDSISLSENDTLTFIRLTMLTGRIW